MQPPKIMLLQGPVGPFFSELHKSLLIKGFSVRQVLFNAGDCLFAPPTGCLRFSGGSEEWETWLRFQFAMDRPGAIILFGSNRPAHEIARRIAAHFGIPVISLEEGYLRSGYIACEIGGNNQHSDLIRWPTSRGGRIWPKPGDLTGEAAPAPHAATAFASMSLWGAIYYLARDLFSRATDEPLFHRAREHPLALVSHWVLHGFRRGLARLTERPARRGLRASPGYMLVPLQVPSDSQLRVAARGWTTQHLIDACLLALLRSGSRQRIVFKLHPLDRQGPRVRRQILARARQFGLERGRIVVLGTGRVSDLARFAGGMVVINSTSAFSALHHDVPVLVLGDAVYRHQSVVTAGENPADVEAFFKLRRAKRRETVDRFIEDLRAQSLVAGDFYHARGRQAAIRGVIAKLALLQEETRPQRRARP